MQLLGLVFVGSATPGRGAMERFAETTRGLRRVAVQGTGAAMFELPDGSHFAVDDEREPGSGTSRTVGFLVADLDAAIAELVTAGIAVDDPAETDRARYAHFVAPDGKLYELIEER